MQIRPYMLFGESALQGLRASLSGYLSEWWRDWGPRDAGLDIASLQQIVDIAADEESRDILVFGEPGVSNDWLMVFVDRGFYEDMGSLLLQDSRVSPRHGAIESSLVAEVVMDALGDLVTRVFPGSVEVGLPGASVKKTALAEFTVSLMPMSGAGIVRAEIRLDDVIIEIWISSALSESLSGVSLAVSDQKFSSPALSSLSGALVNQRVPVSVMLGHAELTLESLGALEVGDVIRLDEPVDAPSLITFAESAIVCKGYLGKKDGSLAIRIDSVTNG